MIRRFIRQPKPFPGSLSWPLFARASDTTATKHTHFPHSRRFRAAFPLDNPDPPPPPPPKPCTRVHTLSVRVGIPWPAAVGTHTHTHLLHSFIVGHDRERTSRRETTTTTGPGRALAANVGGERTHGGGRTFFLRDSGSHLSRGPGAINSRIFTTGHSAGFHKLYEITNVRVRYTTTTRRGRMWAK